MLLRLCRGNAAVQAASEGILGYRLLALSGIALYVSFYLFVYLFLYLILAVFCNVNFVLFQCI